MKFVWPWYWCVHSPVVSQRLIVVSLLAERNSTSERMARARTQSVCPDYRTKGKVFFIRRCRLGAWLNKEVVYKPLKDYGKCKGLSFIFVLLQLSISHYGLGTLQHEMLLLNISSIMLAYLWMSSHICQLSTSWWSYLPTQLTWALVSAWVLRPIQLPHVLSVSSHCAGWAIPWQLCPRNRWVKCQTCRQLVCKL